MADELFHFVRKVPAGKWMVKKKFVGPWRITGLQGFDSDYANLCGPAKMKISSRGPGRMNFGAVEMDLDCKTDDLDERVLHFTFEGADEGDPISGRGYCRVEKDEMAGRLFFHFGDEFGFRAKRAAKSKET